ncbi:bifunctional endoribonuclease/protein kinase ire1 [Lithohypha guttulata]|uniref:non-specific serine/threonine protein kinase n=1 Tax=Lithohypha guttulata TaxID=1690604 RepID=A0AAN7YJJ6_9EURO|nr:bifunctional endoribonuclease/protein kinase ire1 [Lithohypha guttulata]
MGPSRHSRGGTTTKWLLGTLCLLQLSSLSTTSEISSGRDPPVVATIRNAQAGRSPAEIPLLNHDIPTPKFRNTDDEYERYRALAPVSREPAVRAPSVQSVESQALSPLGPARLLSDWEADDIILLSTIDGALHARDRRTGRKRWTLEIENNPMIETIHYLQNRSNADELLAQDDYIFIVEPSSDGQLYAQFADPSLGLLKLPTTVREMATKGAVSMNITGEYLTTTSSQESKAYTIDAQTGEILSEFPRPKTSVKTDLQPRCRPRSGLDIEDSACKPERTLRLGRNTYTFTISSEATGQEICTIRFSEWVSNRADQDLQTQHSRSLDDYDIHTFHNGLVMGVDVTNDEHRQHKYRYSLDTPVARIFDVARKVNTGTDDSDDLVLLSRSADYIIPGTAQLMRQDPAWSQRVFINQTDGGQWYAMSEQCYPGVTTTALLAGVEQRKQNPYLTDQPLDLHGELREIIGVHQLSGEVTNPQKRLTIGAPSPAAAADTDVIVEPEKALLPSETLLVDNNLSQKFWGGIFGLACIVLSFAYGRYSQSRKTGLLKLPAGFVSISEERQPDNQVPSNQVAEKPLPSLPVAAPHDTPEPPVGEALTPSHSRMQSVASVAGSPKKGRENSSDDESEDEEGLNGDNTVQPLPEERKKKKTKRGVRGGRKIRKRGDATTFEPKPVVSQEKHLKDGMVQVGRLTYDSKLESCLGQGSSGTAVFPGTFDGRCVAVKRLVKTANSLAEKEIRHLVSSDEHLNVIRYHGKEESPSFFYIALDRFDTSLDQFVEYPNKYPTLVSSTRGYDVKSALRQIAQGVQHLHSLKLVHRDIKPQNILVRPVRTNRPLQEGQLTPLLFVISDFGLCKPLEDGPESVFAATRTAAGTTGWKAPELLVSSRDAIAAPTVTTPGVISSTQSPSFSRSTNTSSDGTIVDPPTGRRATKAIDIFSLGCVFFYVMTRGGHPFDKGGSPLARDLNIKEDKYDTSLLRDSFVGYDYDADDLIMQMIMHNPKLRPDTTGVLQHPYFWKIEHKLDFLCGVSDAYEERKQKITNIHDENAPRTQTELEYLDELAALQAKAEYVIGLRKDGTLQDFLQALPKSFLNEMGKQRKYTGTKMIDLLRVIRNKKNHFHDLPKDVKEMMLRPVVPGAEPRGQIEGYYSFWRDRFPSLLVNCHQLLLERGLVEEFGMERYYDGSLL